MNEWNRAVETGTLNSRPMAGEQYYLLFDLE